MPGRRGITLAAAAVLAASGAAAREEGPGSWGVTGFGGVLLDTTFDEVLSEPHRIDTESAQLAGVAAAVRLWEPVEGRLHHRSTAFGTFGEEGGANDLVPGLRHRF